MMILSGIHRHKITLPSVRPYVRIVLVILCIHLFFRFYNLEKWASFGWDQIDNAWASAKILLAHKFPLIGMEAKRNSGFYIGPFYYYLTALFYAATGLHPIASPILAATTSVFSFFVIYVISKKLFSIPVAVWAVTIYTFSSHIITTERSQWPINFIPALSYMLLYVYDRIVSGKHQYFIHLAILTGFYFHIHVTAIFFPIITILILPFISYTRKTAAFFAVSIFIGLLFFIPQGMYYMNAKHTGDLTRYTGYIGQNYHGIHARRILQIAPDAFIKFQSILETPYKLLKPVIYLYIPLFFLLYLREKRRKDAVRLVYLLSLWIGVPWLVFSTYRGEISDYYFSSTTYVAVAVLAWLSNHIWTNSRVTGKLILAVFWIYFAFTNTLSFFNTDNDQQFIKNMTRVKIVTDVNQYIEFSEGDPQSYMFFYQMYHEHKPLPYKL